MKTTKPPQASFVTLHGIAQRWRCDVDQVRIFGAIDGLELRELDIPGGAVWGATPEELERFEAQGKPAKPPRFNPSEKSSLLYLIGAMAAVWAGMERDFVDHPYKLQKLIEGDAAAKGIPMLRSAETDANAISAGLELLRARGFLGAVERKPSEHRTPAESSDAPEARA